MDVSTHPLVHDGARWKRGRHGTRCAPINTSFSSLPHLTKFFQFPLLPWEPEYAEFFITPGPRPSRPADPVPSTHRDFNVLFGRPVTAIANKQPMETNANE